MLVPVIYSIFILNTLEMETKIWRTVNGYVLIWCSYFCIGLIFHQNSGNMKSLPEKSKSLY